VGGQQRVYRQRIRSTQSLKKIFRAMELIAASRIGKARERVTAASPYSRALTRAVSAVATHANVDHPLTSERPDSRRAAVLIVTSDRGMAGAYSASVIREAERLIEQLAEDGKEAAIYAAGRRAVSYFHFRHREIAGEWTGASDAPSVETAQEIADTLLQAFLADPADGGVGELHVVYTQFVNMVTQTPRVIRMLPLEVVEGVAEPDAGPVPLYDFEPSPEVVLDALLPRYIESRIFFALLQASASELAAR
jgi:F-type H+-transporting ATPase subunit gamma